MAIVPRLEIRQSASLVMTPQLQQAIKLLQLSNLELADYVDSELERNPLLEREDTVEERAPTEERPAEDAPEAAADDGRDGPLDSGDGPADSPEDGGFAGFGLGGRGGGPGPGTDGDDAPSADVADRDATLRDHLTAQLNVEIAEPVDRIIGLHLIDALDEAGYLALDAAAIAALLGCDVARVEATLARMQEFDPPGVFARSLAECLAIQLKDRNRLDPAMQALLDNLDLVARRDFAPLMRRSGVDAGELAEMIAEIRTLDPKPGHAFDQIPARPIVPDILMRPGPGGGWTIELNSETLPRVLVDNQYLARIGRAARTKAERQYLHDCRQSASWLVKSLHQRATTILKVATEIAVQQAAFFARGVEHLRPLVLRDIAAAIDMHESTVSRVTSNKYIATPRGIYELKYFFSTAIASAAGGAAHSAESVRHRIRGLIDGEASEVYSDDRIVDILARDGIDIARRTIAKYREALGIPSSVERRRLKAQPIPA